jgi:hypothetical protein
MLHRHIAGLRQRVYLLLHQRCASASTFSNAAVTAEHGYFLPQVVPLAPAYTLGRVTLGLASAGEHQLQVALPADQLVVVVLQLLAQPTGYEDMADLVVGQAAFHPFRQLSSDGGSAVVAVGQQRLVLTGSEGGAACLPPSCGANEQLPLAWRALLADAVSRKVGCWLHHSGQQCHVMREQAASDGEPAADSTPCRASAGARATGLL